MDTQVLAVGIVTAILILGVLALLLDYRPDDKGARPK